jgi:hypothetical protein
MLISVIDVGTSSFKFFNSVINVLIFSTGYQDKQSAAKFPAPGLCLISKSNSYNLKINFVMRDDGFFIVL